MVYRVHPLNIMSGILHRFLFLDSLDFNTFFCWGSEVRELIEEIDSQKK